ncbi:hypothetical protein AJ79_00838 [Helicocarpus griseus UAMH5409]|uniref:Uncharacterized protein n=1 Tax=Helicocarpus griseus UAMH5409 TaxID=1447875 RepID=A0A2B7YA18_9EURO|nr:hypothetical protein AJ79_00838 [Helicocarpus griseus UAMH5409]
MPVVVNCITPRANKYKPSIDAAATSEDVLRRASPSDYKDGCLVPGLRCRRTSTSHSKPQVPGAIFPSSNGFLHSIIEASGTGTHLVISPADVWFAIISQLVIYETSFRKNNPHPSPTLVGRVLNPDDPSFDDILGVTCSLMPSTHGDAFKPIDFLHELDFSVCEIENTVATNVAVLSSLQDPIPSTTSSIKPLQRYKHQYPASVSIRGCMVDWAKIMRRVDRLCQPQFEENEWGLQLRRVLERIIHSLGNPDLRSTQDFWRNIARPTYENPADEDSLYISGWATAFAYFDSDGCPFWKRNQNPQMRGQWADIRTKIYEGTFHSTSRADDLDEQLSKLSIQEPRSIATAPFLTIRGIPYHAVRVSEIPSGIVRISVRHPQTEPCKVHIVAGSMGIRATAPRSFVDDNDNDCNGASIATSIESNGNFKETPSMTPRQAPLSPTSDFVDVGLGEGDGDSESSDALVDIDDVVNGTSDNTTAAARDVEDDSNGFIQDIFPDAVRVSKAAGPFDTVRPSFQCFVIRQEDE